MIFGEPSGGRSERVSEITNVFLGAGFHAHAHDNIREEIRLKLPGNACFNPASVLVDCSTDALIDDDMLHALYVEMMGEILELGTRLSEATRLHCYLLLLTQPWAVQAWL